MNNDINDRLDRIEARQIDMQQRLVKLEVHAVKV